MKNTLSDLNNYLFEELERLQDDEMSEEELQKEITRSQAVTHVAEAIIRNGELALKTMTAVNEYGLTLERGFQLPPMLSGIQQ